MVDEKFIENSVKAQVELLVSKKLGSIIEGKIIDYLTENLEGEVEDVVDNVKQDIIDDVKNEIESEFDLGDIEDRLSSIEESIENIKAC